MEFDRFLKETLPGLGYDWRRHRRRAVRRKLLGRMRELGITTFEKYRQLLLAEPSELPVFKGLLPVTISRFYRDPGVFETIRDRVLPALLEERGRVEIWSAGAASGEEPYTLAMLAERHFPGREVVITATEIDRACIERARVGIYQESSIRKLPEELRALYLTRVRGGWRISDKIRERVNFIERDILSGEPPGTMDLVLCRNLAFTYFGPELKERTVRVLHSAVRPGGCLVIGRTEFLPPGSEGLFTIQYPMDKIYLRNEDRLQ